MSKSTEELREKLSAAFDAADIEWRLQWHDDKKENGWAVPYLTNRAIQNRLDDTVGQDRWKNDFIPWQGDGKGKEAQLCGISIYFESRNEWVTKWDGAENSDIEAVKGGLSDSMKRAAVQWGIGRYLYGMEPVWVSAETRGKSVVIAREERPKLDKAHGKYADALLRQKEGGNVIPLKKEPQAASPADTQEDAGPRKPAEPECFVVVKAVTAPALSGGQNMNLQLRDPKGEKVEAYLRGVDPAMSAGARLTDVKLTRKKKGDIVYYTLDSYKVYGGQAA